MLRAGLRPWYHLNSEKTLRLIYTGKCRYSFLVTVEIRWRLLDVRHLSNQSSKATSRSLSQRLSPTAFSLKLRMNCTPPRQSFSMCLLKLLYASLFKKSILKLKNLTLVIKKFERRRPHVIQWSTAKA